MIKKLLLTLLLMSAVFAFANSNAETKGDDGVEFTAYFAEPERNWDESNVAMVLKERTGVTLDIEYMVGDMNEKASIMIASGDYPDLIWGSDAQDRFIEAEAMIPLNDLIDQHAPNIKKYYADDLGKMKQADGNIYHIFWDRGTTNYNIDRPSSGFYIQRRVLKEFGYPKIETLDEFNNLIAEYVAKYPETDGQKTTGLEMLVGDTFFDFFIQNPPAAVAGYENDGIVIVDDSNNAKVYMLDDISKRFYQSLNDMFLQGLVDPESFVFNREQWLAKVASGSVVSVGYNHDWNMQEVQNSLFVQGLEDKMFVALPIVLDKGAKEQFQWPVAPVVRDGVGITVACEDPVAAIKYLDAMLAEDIQKMMFWGTEGKDWQYDENGKMYRTQAQRDATKDLQYQMQTGIGLTRGFPQNLGTAKYSDGNVWSPLFDGTEVNESYSAWDKEVLSAYGVDVFTELFDESKASGYGFAWGMAPTDGTDAQVVETTLRDLMRQYLPKLILADEGEFETIWADYAKDYEKIDYKVLEDHYTTVIKNRVAEWTY